MKAILPCAAVFGTVLFLSAPALRAQQQLYTNGSIVTGATARDGTPAPAGYQWSELQSNTGNVTETNQSAGFSANRNENARLADDFTVPAGRQWTLGSATFFAYVPATTPPPPGAPSPFAQLYVRIWNGPPNNPASRVVYGDLSTDRLASAVEAFVYRIGNTLVPTATAPSFGRKVYRLRATFAPAVTLPAGTYWLEWQSAALGLAAHFYVPTTVVGVRSPPGANALNVSDFTSGAWVPASDIGNPVTAPDAPQDMAFVLNEPTPLAVGSPAAAPAFTVSPVPAVGDGVRAEFEASAQPARFELTDVQGRRLWQGRSVAGSTTLHVPLAGLAAGCYLLTMSSARGTARVRLLRP